MFVIGKTRVEKGGIREKKESQKNGIIIMRAGGTESLLGNFMSYAYEKLHPLSFINMDA